MVTLTEPICRIFGTPISEWVERVPNELPQDAVGLRRIIPAVRDNFGIDDCGELRAWSRRAILSLLARGAVPVSPGNKKESGYFWIERWWGANPGEIAERILDDWKAFGEDPVFWNDRWTWLATEGVKRLNG